MYELFIYIVYLLLFPQFFFNRFLSCFPYNEINSNVEWDREEDIDTNLSKNIVDQSIIYCYLVPTSLQLLLYVYVFGNFYETKYL